MDPQPDGTSSDAPIRSRGQLKEFMKQAKAGKMPNVNGNAHVLSQAAGGESDGDDDFVIRTDKMSLNSTHANSGRPLSNKGKGKGKGKDAPAAVSGGGSQANGASEEDLYD